jgi:hypothetical protein
MSALEQTIRGPISEQVAAPKKKRRNTKQEASSVESPAAEVEEQEDKQKGKPTRASKRTEEKKLSMKRMPQFYSVRLMLPNAELRMIRAVSDEAFPPGKSPLGKLAASEHLLRVEQSPANPAAGIAETVSSV